MNEIIKLDKTDKSILNALFDNSRLSYRQIAKKAGISAATVMHRVNSLVRSEIIKKYSIVIDYDKIGYEIPVVVNVQVSHGKLAQVEEKIARDLNVMAVYDVTGDFDIVIIAKFKTRRLMDKFIKRLQTYDFVTRTETRLILNTIKEEEIRLD